MKKAWILIFFGLFLTGCYTNSLTMVGPATGVVQGKFSETALSSSVNHVVKKQTGKTPVEHLMTEKQIKTYEKKKKQLNPCEQNLKLCNAIKTRIQNTRKLLALN
tara:strand:+ start:7940 stop:8254 length:315 start_codon:yes stop_codon:yes gene_type:complete